MKPAVIKIFLLVLTLSTQEIFSQNNTPDEGYKVKFSYYGYKDKREMIYRQLIKEDDTDYVYPISKDDIGIDLYDIDDDGEYEILSYIQHSGYCGSLGCRFQVLKKFHKITCDNKIKCDCPYKAVAFGDKYNEDIIVYDEIKIMQNKNLGFHDFMCLYRDDSPGVNVVPKIWRWQGEYYDLVQ